MMDDLVISDDAWDRAVTVTGGDARLLLRGLLALSPCVIRAIYEGAGADFAMLSKSQPVAALADAAMKAALARYGDGKPLDALLDDHLEALKDSAWRNHRADMRRLRGPGGAMELLNMSRRRYAAIWPNSR